MLNVACFVQSCLTDADFVIFSNYCLIGTRLKAVFLYYSLRRSIALCLAAFRVLRLFFTAGIL